MSELIKDSLPTPTKQRFAAALRVVSRFSFWIQLALASTSGIALIFVILSRNLGEATGNIGITFSIFLAVVGVFLAGFSIIWASRDRGLAKRLQSSDRTIHPRKKEVIQALKIGLIVSFVGMLIAFVASEVSAIAVLSKSLSVLEREYVIGLCLINLGRNGSLSSHCINRNDAPLQIEQL